MQIPLNEVVHFDVVLTDPESGDVSDADSTPTFSVFEEDNDTPIVGPSNLTKRTGLTGEYRGTFTASLANGFEVGKWYTVKAYATVNEFVGKRDKMLFRVLPAESAVGVPAVDITHILGTASPADPGYVGTDHEQIANPTATQQLTATTVGAIGTGGIATASIADGAITDAKFTVPAVTGVATGILSMIVQVWRRFFKKATKTGTEIKTFADNGTSVLTTQPVSDTAGTESQGAAS